jgi:hypothetical protein
MTTLSRLRSPLARVLSPWLSSTLGSTQQQQQCIREYAAQPQSQTTTSPLPQMPPFDHKPAPYVGPSKEEVRRRGQWTKRLDTPRFLFFWSIARARVHLCSPVAVVFVVLPAVLECMLHPTQPAANSTHTST